MAPCPRCEKAVYFAEQVTGPGGLWHKTCLTCYTCNKRLDAGNLSERENQPFCKQCYAKNFGPKGYGYGNGTMNQDKTPNESTSNIGSKANLSGSNPQLQQQSYLSLSQNNLGSNSSLGKKSTIPANPNVCPRCEKQVYFAEQVIGPNSQKYHKGCFRCVCNKALDSTNLTEKDGVIYCKPCYSKNFGPKGYGFSGGGAFLSS